MNGEKLIQQQIDSHRQLNLLSPRQTSGFCFAGTTQELITQLAANLFTEKEEQDLLRFTVQATLSSFYRLNQFYQFDQTAEVALETIYQLLLQDIKNEEESDIDFARLAESHYLRLQRWLTEYQPEATFLYAAAQPMITNGVVCAEYSAFTQLQTLGIDISDLAEPILDLGCGKDHHLVNYLHARGFDVYGMDRNATPAEKIFRRSWIDAVFQPGYWGTIISHLGFSNHFMHHHLKAKSDHLLYARKYVELLKALKVGGRFYYAPDLLFIEIYLDANQYSLQKKQVPQTTFYTSAVQRLF
ncbi:MAG TPA: hypothetical protein VGN63_00235 [Flavisolibacter sp.]|nr:hypothetical protein [Flavisolibacter sp.]